MGIFDFFLATLSEIPASIIAYLLVDTQKVGRIRIIFASLIFYKFLLFGLGAILFFSKFAGLVAQPVTSESYDTNFRSMGLGICAASGRAAGALAPFVLYKIFFDLQQNNDLQQNEKKIN
ncbi:major facilitator superfamily protein, putative [Ichthyophthirius multifiliis]|uniref:Major facilitator superfamily protein, putative n=1 Tax=Ichthyophthirius multifiliis TaxID=5932 RepID=G0QMN6_ICHMU|nr:major facilitator superfamily protein, putative [Ichthyophthirius multifiliis]EGR33520.1 major facilitator superfamily protein, putative [Ichthyophthirius multifiliis]|eukprot:XP_004037506.1 major facilitator superfamily protein, putative [Ichthyophthirius multifiliis]